MPRHAITSGDSTGLPRRRTSSEIEPSDVATGPKQYHPQKASPDRIHDRRRGLPQSFGANVGAYAYASKLFVLGGEDHSNDPKRHLRGLGDGVYEKTLGKVFDGHHGGCVERRRDWGYWCQYDGKLSLTVFKGKLFLYARANLAEVRGGRFVQVAVADDPLAPSFSPF